MNARETLNLGTGRLYECEIRKVGNGYGVQIIRDVGAATVSVACRAKGMTFAGWFAMNEIALKNRKDAAK